MSQGVLIIATGYPQYYSMALNLAVSLKTVNKVDICLVTDLSDMIRPGHEYFFDIVKNVTKEDMKVNGKVENASLKTRMYELSPFSKTVYIDADSVWLPERKIDHLFEECSDSPVYFQVVHEHDLSKEWKCLWTASDKGNTGLADIRKLIGREKGRIYEMQSSFMYFDKSKKAKKFFDDANKFYIERPFYFHTWGDGMPDELAFNVSTAINQTKLTKFPFTPCYFVDYDMNKYLMGQNSVAIQKDFYLMSMAGNANPKRMVDLYNDLVTLYYSRNQIRIRFPYLWQNKKQFASNRLEI
jgi:hypothetical protein